MLTVRLVVVLGAFGLIVTHSRCGRARIADARAIDELCALLDGALVATIDQAPNRLRASRLVDLPVLRPFMRRRHVAVAWSVTPLVAGNVSALPYGGVMTPLRARAQDRDRRPLGSASP